MTIVIFLLILCAISKNNTIIIKLNGIGKQKILYGSFYDTPSVLINEKETELFSNNSIQVNSSNDIIKLIWDYNLTDCDSMFYGLSNITSIDFSDFDSSHVISMENMFYNCINLKHINFKNFNTSKVETMFQMFYKCESITFLDLTNFDTSNVLNMKYMFRNCINLKKLILGEFKNTYTTNIYGTFQNCSSLKTLDLTKFYTPRVEIMWDMFNGCSSLITLNLSSFDTSQVTDMESMFDGCNNLVSLNLSHFETSRVEYMNKMFRYCYKLNYLDFRNINTNSVGTMSQMFYQCTSLIYINLYSINYEPSSTSSMFTNTSGNFTYCINSYSSIPTIRSYLEKLNTTSNCLNFAFPLIEVFEEELSTTEIIEVFEEELSTTEIIEVFEDEPCTKEYPYKNSKNICVEKCSINDLEEGKCILNYTITINENKTEIDKEQDKLNNIKEELMNGYNTSGIDSGQDVVIKNEETGVTISITSTENQRNNRDKNVTSINLGECENKLKTKYNISSTAQLYILKIDIEQEGMELPKIEYEVYYPLYNSSLVKLDLDVCNDTKIVIIYPSYMTGNLDQLNASSGFFNDICYTYTSENGTDMSLTERQNNFVENNKTKCEENCEFIEYDELKNKVVCSCIIKLNLPFIKEIYFDKEKLYEKFVNINNIGNFKLLECYDVLFTKEGISNNIGCFIIIPIIVLYFVCIIVFYKRDFKILKTKINEIIFAKNNIKILEPKKSQTTLQKRKSMLKFKNTGNPNGLKKRRNKSMISRIVSDSNIKDKNLKKLEFKKLRQNLDINKINLQQKRYSYSEEDFKENKEGKIKQKINYKIHNENKKSNYILNFYPNQLNKRSSKIVSNPIRKLNKKSKNSKTNKINRDQSRNKLKSLETDYNINNFNKSEILKKFQKMNKNDKMKALDDILSYNDLELNILEYEEAFAIDNRSYISYYLSQLRTKNLFIFSFWPNQNDYNSRIVKIYLFFFIFTIYYTVNACFFDESTLQQINEDGGEFNFIYQIPQILYSSLICILLNSIMKYFALSEHNIVKLKQEKIRYIFMKRTKNTIQNLKCKFAFFFIISFVLLIFFWYYLGCFCAIYKNTQLHLLKDSVISFGFSLLYPFGYYLIPGLFRIPALYKKDRKCLYNLSKLIQALL